MTRLIAHRGLMNGPDKTLENHPDQILKVIQLGFDCEVDLWVNSERTLFLGHDGPEYQISEDYLIRHKQKLWVHAKNIEALYWLSSTDIVYFWHQDDDYTLTSNNYIWTYPNKPLTDRSISVLPELFLDKFDNINQLECFGICTDYVNDCNRSIL
jgi:hypothetical protein